MPSTELPDRVIEWTLHVVNGGGIPLTVLEANDITRRKHTENHLRNLSRAVEQSPASVMITNVKSVIEYVNPRFTQVSWIRL